MFNFNLVYLLTLRHNLAQEQNGKVGLLKHSILSDSSVLRQKIRGTKKPQTVTGPHKVCGPSKGAEGGAAQGSGCKVTTARLLGTALVRKGGRKTHLAFSTS